MLPVFNFDPPMHWGRSCLQLHLIIYDRLPSLIGEVSDSDFTNTDHNGYYYDELPCNMKKDAHTGKNVYQGEDVHCIHKIFLKND